MLAELSYLWLNLFKIQSLKNKAFEWTSGFLNGYLLNKLIYSSNLKYSYSLALWLGQRNFLDDRKMHYDQCLNSFSVPRHTITHKNKSKRHLFLYIFSDRGWGSHLMMVFLVASIMCEVPWGETGACETQPDSQLSPSQLSRCPTHTAVIHCMTTLSH